VPIVGAFNGGLDIRHSDWSPLSSPTCSRVWCTVNLWHF